LLHASAISHLICITTASMLRLTTMSRLQRARRAAGHQHPQHLVAALARLAQA
jgi:hypothetical protein